jgi:hypothetical protein
MNQLTTTVVALCQRKVGTPGLVSSHALGSHTMVINIQIWDLNSLSNIFPSTLYKTRNNMTVICYQSADSSQVTSVVWQNTGIWPMTWCRWLRGMFFSVPCLCHTDSVSAARHQLLQTGYKNILHMSPEKSLLWPAHDELSYPLVQAGWCLESSVHRKREVTSVSVTLVAIGQVKLKNSKISLKNSKIPHSEL